MEFKERYSFYLYDKDRKPPYDTHSKVLNKIEKPVVTLKLNGINELKFSYPMSAEEVPYFKINHIVTYMGVPYRIQRLTEVHNQTDEPTVQVECQDARMLDMGKKVIPDFFMIGKTPREMLVEAFSGTEYHVMTKAEVTAKGMEWWDVPTDLELNRTTPLKVLQQVIDLTGGGEIYLEDYNVALVKRIGQKRIVPLRFGKNLRGLERDIDARNLMTVVYPIGQDDLHIDYVTQGNQQYIRSRWADVFGKIEGYLECSDIEALGEDDPDSFNGSSALYWTACANMDAPIHCGNSNLKTAKNKYVNTAGIKNKVDLPVVEYRITFADLAFLEERKEYEYRLGDVVPVIDEYFCINTSGQQENDYLNLEQQVIEVEIHPNEPTENALRLGQDKRTVGMSITDGVHSAEYIGNNTDKDNNIKEDSVEGTERTETITITPMGDSTVRITDRFGVRSLGHVYYDDTKNPHYAVCISKSVIAMGSKNGSKWQWYNVISNGKGHLDSHMWVGSLSTTLVDIMSDNGKLTIQDSLIVIKDQSGTIRLKMGYSSNKFVFEMYNAGGNKTLYMDDNGEIVAINITAVGTLMTGAAGTERTVIDGNGIQAYDASGNRAGLWCNEQLGSIGSAYADMVLYRAGKEIFKVYNNLDGISLYSYGKPFLTSTGTATTAEGRWTLNSSTRINSGTEYINLLGKINELEQRIVALESAPRE